MSTVAVIGSAGQLGSDLVALLRESGRDKVVALSHRDIEVANPRSVRSARGKDGNFIEAIIAKAQRADPIRVVDDIRTSPTYSRDAAAGLEALLRQETTGVVHLTNSGACTWYEFARTILDYAGADATPQAVSSREYGARARRPADSTLVSARLPPLHINRLRPWQEALKAYLIETGRAT